MRDIEQKEIILQNDNHSNSSNIDNEKHILRSDKNRNITNIYNDVQDLIKLTNKHIIYISNQNQKQKNISNKLSDIESKHNDIQQSLNNQNIKKDIDKICNFSLLTQQTYQMKNDNKTKTAILSDYIKQTKHLINLKDREIFNAERKINRILLGERREDNYVPQAPKYSNTYKFYRISRKEIKQQLQTIANKYKEKNKEPIKMSNLIKLLKEYNYNKSINTKKQMTNMEKIYFKKENNYDIDQKDFNKLHYNEVFLARPDNKEQMWDDLKLSLKNSGNYTIAVTLNFNPTNKTPTFNKDMAQDKFNKFIRLYKQNHLGQDCKKYSAINYFGFFEHVDSNIHAHLCISYGYKILDEYDESNIIDVLWKTVINSGTSYVDHIDNFDGWFDYMTKTHSIQNMII